MNAATEDRTPRSSGETRGKQRKRERSVNLSGSDRRAEALFNNRRKLKLAPKAVSSHFKFEAVFPALQSPEEPYVGQHNSM